VKSMLRSVGDHLKEKLKDPRFRELYELEGEKSKIVSLIIKFRLEHRLTQGQLAKKVGVTQQQISKIEQGEFSSLATVQRVLLAIGHHMVVRAVPLEPRLRRVFQAAA